MRRSEGDRSVACSNVNIRVMILNYSFARYDHWGKQDKGYTESLCCFFMTEWKSAIIFKSLIKKCTSPIVILCGCGEVVLGKVNSFSKHLLTPSICSAVVYVNIGSQYIDSERLAQGAGRMRSRIQTQIWTPGCTSTSINSVSSTRVLFSLQNDQVKTTKVECGDSYNTGDKANINTEGYIWFLGRDNDIINTYG